MTNWKMLSIEDSASPHDHVLLILLLITILVGYLMLSLFFNKFSYCYCYLLEGQMIELIWTFLTAITLIFIALPSLRLLYLLDGVNNLLLMLKLLDINDTDHMNTDILKMMNSILMYFHLQIQYSSSHSNYCSWCSTFKNNSFSVKIDATPGSLNKGMLLLNRMELLFGQCSEICGANHSFVPIVIESISPSYLIKWIHEMA